MYKKLLSYLKERPKEYDADRTMLWDDEHISKGMLKAHLDPNVDSASRKEAFIDASVNWISSVCDLKDNSRLLDLGCGPGIYAEKFDDAGFIVTGIDFSRRSIEYAKNSTVEKSKKIKYIYQNYLDIDYKNEFDIATLIYYDFGALEPLDRQKLLKKIKQALKPGGKLILDVLTKYYYLDSIEEQKITYENSGFWRPVPYCCIARTFRYEESNLFLEQYIIITEDECKCYNNWNQIFDKNMLCDELNEAGFTDLQFYEDVTGKEYSDGCKTICLLAK